MYVKYVYLLRNLISFYNFAGYDVYLFEVVNMKFFWSLFYVKIMGMAEPLNYLLVKDENTSNIRDLS